ncbi:MAG: hypothetical protein ABJG68_02640 [Crocinitomicaceae bacterium]
MPKQTLIFALLLTIFSCTKSSKYSGDYACKVESSYWELYEDSSDTTFHTILEVKKEKKAIIVLNNKIHVDSLHEGEWFNYSGYPSIFEVKVSGDSMYVYSYYGGQGGGSGNLYSCEK